MKIFISMPMKSKSVEQIKKEMGIVFDYIKEKLPEAELINSVIDGADKKIALKGNDIAIWYLSKGIELLSGADLVFFVDGYKEYRGCNVERMVADSYGKFCVDIKIQ